MMSSSPPPPQEHHAARRQERQARRLEGGEDGDGVEAVGFASPKLWRYNAMHMTHLIDAIYENGVLRLLSPLPLPEHARVRLSVDDRAVDDPVDGTAGDDRAPWLAQSERALMKVWDNAGDDVFNELLTP